LFSGLVGQGLVVAFLAAIVGGLVANVLAPVIPLPSVIPTAAFAVLPAVAVAVGLLASLAGFRRAVGADPAMAFGS
jgi:putative ABC transport system permease protein